MVTNMNRDALARRSNSAAVYWSRSRQELWHKGATSGLVQKVEEILVDDDQDAVGSESTQGGASCHVGYRSCFYRRIPVGADANGRPARARVHDHREGLRPDRGLR